MQKFTSIESFRHAIKKVRRFYDNKQQAYPTLKYRGTVKLHGTNAGIRKTPSGKIQPQGRNRILAIDSDNYGFAFFVESHMDAVKNLFSKFDEKDDVTIFGEWCGGNIQKNVALTQLEKHFVIFRILVNDVYVENDVNIQDNENGIYNILQIPEYEVDIDFMNPAPASEILSDLTIAVENECPWGKFRGVTGVGEGIVWVPDADVSISDIWFKTKGLKHKNAGEKAKKQKIKIEPEQLENMMAVVNEVLPEWRLEQGLSHLKENGLPKLPESTGPYLKWVANDIIKEEMDILIKNGFEWKQIQGKIMNTARQFFLKECEKVDD
jgi:hypothetical protein